jgi:hypothetical protein
MITSAPSAQTAQGNGTKDEACAKAGLDKIKPGCSSRPDAHATYQERGHRELGIREWGSPWRLDLEPTGLEPLNGSLSSGLAQTKQSPEACA